MCLILIGYKVHPDVPLIVAANRDEAHVRASAAAAWWTDAPQVLAGRDLEAGGTWLGVTKDGRFAAVTNFAEPGASAPRSRGELTQNFLTSHVSSLTYAKSLDLPAYRGFNLLLWDGVTFVYTHNQSGTAAEAVQVLTPGYYGLSNAELGAAWPKSLQGQERLRQAIASDVEPHALNDQLIALLGDHSIPPDADLPDRGRPLELERKVAPCFIMGEEYGTRASTAVIISRDRLSFSEQSYGPMGLDIGRHDYDSSTH